MRNGKLIMAASAVFLPGIAQAQPVVIADSGDTGWMLAASLLILIGVGPGLLIAQRRGLYDSAGVALFATAAIVTLIFVLFGFSLAFSDGTGLLGGLSNIMLDGLVDVQPDMTISGTVYALFELTVAIFAVTIVTAWVGGYVKIGWMLAFAALWTTIVYVPVVHWIWGGGWLAELGALDYAGGIVIQTSAGVSALVVAALLGRDRRAVDPADERGLLGGYALLGIGWLALIGGSAFGATDDAASAILNAMLAASAALLTGLLTEQLKTRTITAQGAAVSTIAGLAAVSAGADIIAPGGAILLGIIGAIGALGAGALVARFRLSGAARGFLAHGGGGVVGALAFPLFVLPLFGGPGYDVGMTLGGQLLAQAVAVIAVALWAAIGSAIAALMISMVLPMSTKDNSL